MGSHCIPRASRCPVHSPWNSLHKQHLLRKAPLNTISDTLYILWSESLLFFLFSLLSRYKKKPTDTTNFFFFFFNPIPVWLLQQVTFKALNSSFMCCPMFDPILKLTWVSLFSPQKPPKLTGNNTGHCNKADLGSACSLSSVFIFLTTTTHQQHHFHLKMTT